MQIWGIWRNGPNDLRGNFAFYAEEHGFGEEGGDGRVELGVVREVQEGNTRGLEARAPSPPTYTITPNESWNLDIAPALGRGLPARGKHTQGTPGT